MLQPRGKLAHAAQVCKRLGKPAGIIGPNPEMVARYVGYGYTWVAIGSDMSMMMGRAQEWLGLARGRPHVAGPPAQGSY